MLRYCMRGVAEKNARVVQDMYEAGMTAVRRAVGMTGGNVSRVDRAISCLQ